MISYILGWHICKGEHKEAIEKNIPDRSLFEKKMLNTMTKISAVIYVFQRQFLE